MFAAPVGLTQSPSSPAQTGYNGACPIPDIALRRPIA